MPDLKQLEHLLTRGKITRREFIARLSALGLMASVSPALLATSAKAATPQKGGRLRLGMAGGSTTDSLDPATMTDAMTYNINWQVRNCLVEVDNKEGLRRSNDLFALVFLAFHSTVAASKFRPESGRNVGNGPVEKKVGGSSRGRQRR